MTITMLPILKSITEIMKNFKSLYGFGGRCLKIRDVCNKRLNAGEPHNVEQNYYYIS